VPLEEEEVAPAKNSDFGNNIFDYKREERENESDGKENIQ